MPTIGSKKGKTPWSSTAFMIEALVLLFVLVASLAVFTTLFAFSATNAQQAKRVSEASVVAQNVAEEFVADPAGVVIGDTVGAGAALGGGTWTVSCEITGIQQGEVGALYTAHITVSDAQGEAYALNTSRYVKEAN